MKRSISSGLLLRNDHLSQGEISKEAFQVKKVLLSITFQVFLKKRANR